MASESCACSPGFYGLFFLSLGPAHTFFCHHLKKCCVGETPLSTTWPIHPPALKRLLNTGGRGMADGGTEPGLTSCALLIGNSEFTHLNPLPGVVDELATMKAAFERCGVEDGGESMQVYPNCDEGQLQRALQMCYATAEKHRPTLKTCFVYISSHGMRPPADGAAAQAPTEGGVCAVESGPDPASFKGLTTAKMQKSLFWPLSKLGVKVLCILDICYAASTGQPKDAAAASTKVPWCEDGIESGPPPVNSVIIHVARRWEKAFTNVFANAFKGVITDAQVYNDSDRLTVFRLFKELKNAMISYAQSPVLSAFVEDDFVVAELPGEGMNLDPQDPPPADPQPKDPAENNAETVRAVLQNAAKKRPTFGPFFSSEPLKPIARFVKLNNHVQCFEADWSVAFECLGECLQATKSSVEREILLFTFGGALARSNSPPDFDAVFAVQNEGVFKGVCGLAVLTALAIGGNTWLRGAHSVPDTALLMVTAAEGVDGFDAVAPPMPARWKCVLASLQYCGLHEDEEGKIWDDEDVLNFAGQVFDNQVWNGSTRTPQFRGPNFEFWSAFWGKGWMSIFDRPVYKPNQTNESPAWDLDNKFMNAMKWIRVDDLRKLGPDMQNELAASYIARGTAPFAAGEESSEFSNWLDEHAPAPPE